MPVVPVLAGLSLVLFFATSARTPVPGPSADAIVRGAGLDGAPMLTHPVWAALMRLAALVPVGANYQRAHFLSALLGAAVVALTAWLVTRWVGRWMKGEAPNTAVGHESLGQAAAWVAGAVLTLEGPFWISATRASPELLSLAMVLSGVALTDLWVVSRAAWLGLAAAALMGVAAVESPAAALHVPLLAAWAVAAGASGMSPARRALMRWPRAVFAAVAAFAVGALAALGAVVAAVAVSPARSWLNAHTTGRMLRLIGRAQAAQFRESLPPLGWILVMLVTLVPAGIVIWALTSPAGRRRARMGAAAAILAALGGAVLLHSPLAPWPTIPTTLPSPFPAAWVAIWLGLTTGMAVWVLRRTRHGTLAPRFVVGAGLGLALGGAVRAFPYVDDRPVRPAGWLAAGVAQESAGADWIVSRGIWDNTVMAAARGRRGPGRWLRLDLAREPEYIARVQAHPWDSPLARAVLPLGLDAWLPLWFDAVPAARTNLLALDVPEVLELDGGTAVAGLWVYRGGPFAPPPIGEIERWRRDAERCRALWQRSRGPWREVGRLALRQASRTMNDLAVRLEEMERPDVAMRAYQASLAADPENVVAALNRARLARRMERLEADRTEQEFMRLVEAQAQRIDLLGLRSAYGRLRDPSWLLERSRRLAMAGRLDEALLELGQAMMSGGTNDVAIAAVARVLAAQRHWAEARAALDEGEQRFPNSSAIAAARRWLDDGPGATEPSGDRADDLTRAALCVLRGDWSGAESALRVHLDRETDDPAAAAMGALLALHRGDARAARSLAERAIRRNGPRSPLAYLVLAGAAMAESRWPEARRTLEEALGQYPQLLAARRLLAIWAHQQQDVAALNTHLAGWLRQSPKDPIALQLLAERYATARQFDRTEAILRYLVNRHPSAGLWNGLAWALWRQERNDEALPAAEEAVRLAPEYADAWANLAAIRWDLGRRDEAHAALAEAERLSPTSEVVRARAMLIRDGRGSAAVSP